MMIAYNLPKANTENFEKINRLADYITATGHEFIGLTSTLNLAEEFKANHDIHFDFYGMDEIALKTIIRANPGLLVLKDGVVIAKYHGNDVPDVEELNGDIFSALLSQQTKNKAKNTRNLYIFFGLATILFLFAAEKQVRNCPFKSKN